MRCECCEIVDRNFARMRVPVSCRAGSRRSNVLAALLKDAEASNVNVLRKDYAPVGEAVSEKQCDCLTARREMTRVSKKTASRSMHHAGTRGLAATGFATRGRPAISVDALSL